MATNAGFQLPTWAMLSAEQETIVNMPTTKDYVVQGSPGTGKTVMALYRAARIAQRDDCDVTILVYNRPLMMYMQTATEGNSLFKKVKISTYHSWLVELYKQKFDSSAPKLDKFEFDWDKIVRDAAKIANCKNHIIIDEAQDFPIELIQALKVISKNITCFIDPNQAIEAGKTDVTDALKKLCVECPKSLMTNYRNTKPIAELSKVYWNGRGCFAEPNESGAGATKPRMVKCSDYDDQLEKMARIIRANKEKTIGILVNNKSLNVTFNGLKDELGGEVGVEMFKAMAKTDEINFNTKGVKVLSFGTMKGLEFDLVIVGRFEKMKSTGDPDADTNRAYVAITRACKELCICYFDTRCTAGWSDVMNQITTNKNLCKWE